METNELKIIWQTLANEKLIDKKLADENIERIISLKSSNTIAKLNKKLKFDYATNVIASVFIVGATLFVSVYNKQYNHTMPIDAYIFLFFTFGFFVIRSIVGYSKIRLFKMSFTSSTIKDSLRKVKMAIEKTSKKEGIYTYAAFVVIVVFANIHLNEHTDFSNFNINSLQGYVLIFSIFSLILPWAGKFILIRKFPTIIKSVNNIMFRDINSIILKDIDASLAELDEL
jgi:hypothetical protein